MAVFEKSSARFGVGRARSAAWRHGEVFLGARRRGKESRGRVAVFSSARGGGRGHGGARSAARRGVRRVSAWTKALGREVCSSVSWRCVPRHVPAWAKVRWPAGPQPGVVAMYSSLRIGVGKDAEAFGSINFGRPGALLSSSVAFGSVGLCVSTSASGGAA